MNDEELYEDFKRSADFAYRQFCYLLDLAYRFVDEHPELFDEVNEKGTLEIAGAILEIMKVLS